jgi:hypothetical protein
MLHILLAIVLIVAGIGLIGAPRARSTVASRRGSAAVSTTTSEMTWILPIAGGALILVGILAAARVF